MAVRGAFVIKICVLTVVKGAAVLADAPGAGGRARH
jgi:hypothetical protein